MQSFFTPPEGIDLSELRIEILELKAQGTSHIAISRELDCSTRYVRQTIKTYGHLLDDVTTDVMTQQALSLEMRNQRLRDQQRVERKVRGEFRYASALGEYASELAIALEGRGLYNPTMHKAYNPNAQGIIQVSDTHFNELISMQHNQYDFTIGSQRLKKFALESKRIFGAYNIKKVLVAFTGDLINSDRRLDELLNMATNRARATALTSIILEQFLMDLNRSFDVEVTYVSGNESRLNQEIGHSDISVSDNYDTMIFEMLRLMFRKSKGMVFFDNPIQEHVVKVLNKNILIIHGHTIKNGNVSTQIQKIKTKWTDHIGEKIDFVIWGHYHAAQITDLHARSGSLCGGNDYSDHGLQLSTRASQNVYVVRKDSINAMKIDLQDTSGITGYKIEKELEAYHIKSFEKVPSMRPKHI
jgi:predicted phosphodiesterase/transposase-like protein